MNENQELHHKLQEQEARIRELDIAKKMLDQRLQQILEEVQNKECRAKELEDRIATLLEVVADRDKQMEERDQQYERRNQQFDELMARLGVQQPQVPTRTEDKANTNIASRQLQATPARSNKRQNTLSTPSRERRDGAQDENADDIMYDALDGKDPHSQC